VFDVGGMVAGTQHMPVLSFLLAGWAGKAIRLTLLALSGQFLLGT
jgi:membrane protein DedA with SNARE-associated domain